MSVRNISILTILKLLVVTTLALSVSMINIAGATPAEDDWIYLDESYGDVYHWQYEGRDKYPHSHLCWVRKELPGRDVVSANGFRWVQYRLVGIDMAEKQYAVYESVWYTRDGEEVDHEYWDSNWRPLRNDELSLLATELKERGYR